MFTNNYNRARLLYSYVCELFEYNYELKIKIVLDEIQS